MSKFYKQKGFTLIELLVVIAIIGLLSAITLSSLNAARIKANNISSIQTVGVYKKAIEMHFLDKESYPIDTSNTSNTYCLGDGYVDNKCNILPLGSFGNPVFESDTINNALKPYVPQLPIDPLNNLIWYVSALGLPKIGNGYLYTCKDASGSKCKKYSLEWLQKGNNTSCLGSPGVYDSTNNTTRCLVIGE